VDDGDDHLLRYYLARGGTDASWNLSAEAAYFDFRARDFLERHAERPLPADVVNLGIGVGLWDDFLGYWLGDTGRVVSVDIDGEVATMLRLRQRREEHPHPAEVVCADLLGDALRPESFDLATLVGSTPIETGDPARAVAAAFGLVRRGGQLFVAGLDELVPLGALERWLDELDVEDLIVDRDRRFPELPIHLVMARRAE
jgi:SAM-dependent methyltransferase